MGVLASCPFLFHSCDSMNARYLQPRIGLVISAALTLLLLFNAVTVQAANDRVNYKKLREDLKKHSAELMALSKEMADEFAEGWESVGNAELPIGAEEIVKGSGLYKIRSAECPHGTGEVIAQITRSSTASASAKSEIKILGIGGEIGAEFGGSVGGSLQIKGCLVLDKETRYHNDTSDIWKKFKASLEKQSPLAERVADCKRLLELKTLVPDAESTIEDLKRTLKSKKVDAPQLLVDQLLFVIEEHGKLEEEQDALIKKLITSKVIRFRR